MTFEAEHEFDGSVDTEWKQRSQTVDGQRLAWTEQWQVDGSGRTHVAPLCHDLTIEGKPYPGDPTEYLTRRRLVG